MESDNRKWTLWPELFPPKSEAELEEARIVFERKVAEAEAIGIAAGKEKFSAKKLNEYYGFIHDLELTVPDEDTMIKRAEAKRYDYYTGKATALKEYADMLIEYDVYKDSTGRD
jgi:hypothetical protein